MKNYSRRNFIKAGAATMTIPFLSSLSSRAEAQAASGSLKRVIYFNLSNAWYQDLIFPQLTNYMVGPEGVRYIPLNSISGDISRFFTNAKYGSLKSKMNLLRGLDIGEALGGHDMMYSLCCTSDARGGNLNSIDTVISNSSQFYSSTPFKRSLNHVPTKGGSPHKYNYSFANGSQRSQIQGPSALFTEYFSGSLPGGGTGGQAPPDTFLSRRVAMETALAQLSAFTASPKLSAVDKQRLSQHSEMINRLLPSLAAPAANSGVVVGSGCSKPLAPTGIDESFNSIAGNQARIQASLDLIYMALNCQLTNMVVMHPVVAFDSGSWHMGDTGNDVYHQMAGHHYQVADYLKYKGWIFDQLLYLLNMMESTRESNGLTMLDNSLVVVISNDACGVHSYQDIPVITFGSLGGAIKTGNYINYQVAGLGNQKGGYLDYVPKGSGPGGTYYTTYNYTLGRPLASFHTTVLNALGIPNSGFGDYSGLGSNYSQFLTAAAKAASLPLL